MQTKIYPAIDIIDGNCVRLMKGDYDTMKVYGSNPIEMALGFKQAGAEYLHVVDLDAAKNPEINNRKIIAEIIRHSGLKVQTGGGNQVTAGCRYLIGYRTVLLFAGMLIHGLFAECLGKASTLIVSNSNYVKKVIFPLEVLVWTTVGAALFHFFTGLIVLLVMQLFLVGALDWTIFFLPMIVLPFVLFLSGLSWAVAALGVFFRDVSQMINMVISIMMFLSPVFYSVESVPERYRQYMLVNPLTLVIEQARAVLVRGELPDWTSVLAIFCTGSVTCVCGLWFFNKTRKGFGDVL